MIFTDHKNLEVFMSTKILNRRQARWAELLSGYDFVLVHTPGSTNPADGPSRRPDYATDVPQPSGSLVPPSVFQSYSPHPPPDLPHSAQVFRISASLSVFTPDTTLRQQFINAYNTDAIAMAQKISTTDGYQWQNDLLLHKSQVYVHHSLCLDVLRMHHDDHLAGHFGVARTLELLSRNYWFPSMSSDVEKYVSIYDICSRGKPSRHLKHGELMPLPVPPGPWKGITCNFVTDLPVSNGHDSLLVFVDRFTKMCHVIPCNKTTDAPQFTCMFLDHVARLHGVPDSLVSDRGSIFTSQFWKCLSQLLGIKGRLSTAFHPQTDGQTE
jgi:hypothetical protein